MIQGNTKDAIAILELPNDGIFTGIKDEVSLYFTNPNTEVKPFLDLVDDEEVEFKLSDNEMVVNNQCTLCMEDPSTISTFNGNNIEDNVEFFTEVTVDDDFFKILTKMKKIGNRFGKIYFIVDGGKFYIETSDRTNKYSNRMNFMLHSGVESDNLVLCFDYTNVVKLMSIIDNSFTMKFTYFEDQEMGGMYCENENKSEKYFISSMQDE
ncbi:MAG: hypothetical protein K9L74_07670 [Candidatus Izimaplasma sp.]|nr:hypothetical protein [Candidatus Izimaplasma bacterium]